MKLRINVAAIAVCCMAVLAVGGCKPAENAVTATSARPAVRPAAPSLKTPTSAVESYLDWISFSYRQMDSDLASATMTPDELVHVDAYVQFNLQKERGIEQELLNLKVRSVSEESTRAIVAASEEWRYRYFARTTLLYDGPERLVSYETTYTLVRSDGAWLVDAVEATAAGEVP
ncbi:MAG: hypothetical protein Q7V61_10030 [Actinomycetota bacterium]|nr:hypothetical protein [Actinomycetota bacterium]